MATDVKNDATLSTSLVSYWELEEASGTRVDSHGSNDLTDNNTVAQATGIQGDAADFTTGNSEYLSITDASQTGLDFTSDMSWSMWVKIDTAPSSGTFYALTSKWGGGGENCYVFYYYNNGGTLELRFVTDDGTSQPTAIIAQTLTSGTWYHLVVAYDASASSAALYVDGSSAGTFSGLTSSIDDNANADVGIGAFFNTSWQWFFDGVIDEVGAWSKTLTSGEVTDLYNSGTGIPYDNGGAAASNLSARRQHLMMM